MGKATDPNVLVLASYNLLAETVKVLDGATLDGAQAERATEAKGHIEQAQSALAAILHDLAETAELVDVERRAGVPEAQPRRRRKATA